MLANHWIKFLDFHFIRHGLFIFAGGIKVSGARGGYQLNFVSHYLLLSSQPSLWPTMDITDRAQNAQSSR
jgi:hypothetical protein